MIGRDMRFSGARGTPVPHRAAVASVAFALLVGAGCGSFSLRASKARTPILLGPVACIACARAGAGCGSSDGGRRRSRAGVRHCGGRGQDRWRHGALGRCGDEGCLRSLPGRSSRRRHRRWSLGLRRAAAVRDDERVDRRSGEPRDRAERHLQPDRGPAFREAAGREEAVRSEALARLAALGALLACGCAGARVAVSADRANYPVSLSGAVRDKNGYLHDGRSLTKVGSFSAQRTRVGLVYSSWTIPSTYDISDEINVQVASSCGEAVVTSRSRSRTRAPCSISFRFSTPCPCGRVAFL